MENKTNNLEQSVQQLKMENVAIHQSYSSLLQNYSTLQVDHNAVKSKLTAYEKKSTEMLQDINTLKTDTETLKHQVHTLTTNQAARGQDFLALDNQTLAFRSDMARDITKLSSHHNDSIDKLFRNLQNENKTSHQLISNMNKTMHVFNQQIANNVTQSNSEIKKMLHDEIHVISRRIEDESNGYTSGGGGAEKGHLKNRGKSVDRPVWIVIGLIVVLERKTVFSTVTLGMIPEAF
ncbi:unnamed protein product [Mytilus coruscus]|uniref:Uncharacterized protein n=1 Tax=Mytilus coruscus TaxID=42192 RepID=A0A6J8EK81_MYTCO|nr:unnamed protein product [Mytilus coruscus]